MLFTLALPFFAYTAYLDWQKRNIDQAAIAVSWLVFGALVAAEKMNLGMQLLVLFLPIFSLGVFWCQHLITEHAYKNHWLPHKYLRALRFGLGDVFMLPLFLTSMIQFGGFTILVWGVGTFLLAETWFRRLEKTNPHKKQGIPFLTFSFIVLLFVFLMAAISGGA